MVIAPQRDAVPDMNRCGDEANDHDPEAVVRVGERPISDRRTAYQYQAPPGMRISLFEETAGAVKQQ